MSRKFYIFLLLGSSCAALLLFFLLRPADRNTSSEICPASSDIEGIISGGDKLWNILSNEGVNQTENSQVNRALNTIFNVKNIRPGDKYRLALSSSCSVVRFEYIRSPLMAYIVERSTASGFVSRIEKKKLERHIVARSGVLENNLYTSMLRADVDPELIMDFTDIFAWQVDFLTDPRNGDSFSLIWERFENGGMVKEGKIFMAKYITRSGKEFTAIGRGDEEKGWEYYTPEGDSLRKSFLKAPLKFRRISSFFTNRRFHPVLKYYRPHKGIDYAAPHGTPVSSIGDGKVTFAGWTAHGGKTVIIKHNNIYTTYYMHLSRFAMKKGAQVRQGQVVGYVGSTGMSTGPHLDFRIKQHGEFVNFLKLKFPAQKSLKGEEKKEFEKFKKLAFYFEGRLKQSGGFKIALNAEIEWESVMKTRLEEIRNHKNGGKKKI